MFSGCYTYKPLQNHGRDSLGYGTSFGAIVSLSTSASHTCRSLKYSTRQL
jgi:hypothetical protein